MKITHEDQTRGISLQLTDTRCRPQQQRDQVYGEFLTLHFAASLTLEYNLCIACIM